MNLVSAREKYRAGEISYKELHDVFMKQATVEQKLELSNAPAFDKPWVIEGLTKEQRDKRFYGMFN